DARPICTPLRAGIATGIISLHENASGEVSVERGSTRHGPEAVGFDARGRDTSRCGEDTLWHVPGPVGQILPLSLVGISNPHAVLVVDDVATAAVATLGPFLESHPRFAHRVNVGFLEITDLHTARLRVYE